MEPFVGNSDNEFRYIIPSLKILVWKRYKGSIIKYDTPDLMRTYLETEEYIYEFLNRRIYRWASNKEKNLQQIMQNNNMKINISVFNPERMAQNGLFILETLFPKLVIEYKTSEEYIDNLISYNNFNLMEFLFYQSGDDTVKDYIRENASKYLIRICVNKYVEMFEQFMEMCKDLDIKFKTNVEEEKMPGFWYWERRITYDSKATIISVVENDDLKMLKLLEKYEFDIFNDDIIRYARINGKYKCMNYLSRNKEEPVPEAASSSETGNEISSAVSIGAGSIFDEINMPVDYLSDYLLCKTFQEDGETDIYEDDILKNLFNSQ